MRVRFVVLMGALMWGLVGCVGTPPCDATTCPGCCATDGTCQSGDLRTACGFGGAACAECTGVTTCGSARVCGNPVCRPATCASLGRSCGDPTDGCGGVLHCGTCTGREVCTSYGAVGAERWQCGVRCEPECARGTTCSAAGLCTGNLSALAFDETVKSIAAKLRINGVDAVKNAAACSASSNPNDLVARVRWADAAQQITGQHDILCKHADLGFTLRLVPGRYVIGIEPGPAAERAGVLLPFGGWTHSEPLVVSAGTTQVDPKPFFDVKGFSTVQGRLRIDGSAPLQNAFCANAANAERQVAVVEFLNRGSGASTSVELTCTSPSFGFGTRLISGSYDVRISPGAFAAQAGFALPQTAVLVRENQPLTALLNNTSYDLRTATASGTLAVMGAPPNTGGYCTPPAQANDELARVRFIDRAKGHEVSRAILCDPTFAWSVVLPADGIWDVLVSPGPFAQAAGVDLLPMEVQVKDRVSIPAAVTGLLLDERFTRVQGTVTLEGMAPSKGTSFCNLAPTTALATLRFTDTTRAQHQDLTFRCDSADWRYSVDLPEGAWRASIERAAVLDPAATNLPAGRFTFPLTVQAMGTSAVTADLDAEAHDLGVQVRVNDKIPELPLTCTSAPGTVFAVIELTQVSTGIVVTRLLDCPAATSFRVVVPLAPGAWTLRMRAYDPEAPLGGLLPGWFALAEPVTVPVATGNVKLDQRPIPVAGKITVNAATPVTVPGGTAECAFTGPAAFLSFESGAGTYAGTERVDCTSGQAPSWARSFFVHAGDTYRFFLQGADQPTPFNLVLQRVPVVQNLDVR